MATYDFSSLKKDLTEAVINAYMRRACSFITDGSCGEGKFEYIEPGNRYGQQATSLYVTYPGGQWREDGGLIGSSSASSYEPFDAAGAYADIETMIDQAFDPFIEAPQPGDFDDQIAIWRWVAEQLAVGGTVDISGSGSGTRIHAGNEVVPYYIETLRSELANLNGVAVKALRDYYGAAPVENVMSGHYALAVVAGTLVAGEKAMWKQLQQDLSQVLEFGADSFNQFAKGNEISSGEYIDMIDAVAQAAGLFAASGLTKAIGKAAQISGIVDNFLPDAPEKIDYEIKGGSYTEMLDSLGEALTKLNTSIHDTELAFNDCAINAIKEVNNNFGSFDNKRPKDFLKAGDSGIYENSNGVRGDEIDIDDALKTVASRYELIGDHCRDVAKRVEMAAVQAPWVRPAFLGGTYDGHYPNYESLTVGLAHLLRNAAGEMHAVGEKCLLVLSDFKATETQVKHRINHLAKQVEKEVKSHIH